MKRTAWIDFALPVLIAVLLTVVAGLTNADLEIEKRFQGHSLDEIELVLAAAVTAYLEYRGLKQRALYYELFMGKVTDRLSFSESKERPKKIKAG